MTRRHKHQGHANHERWLVSYADFITLLFAFFVVLYASSQVDKAKMGKLAAAIQGAFQELGVFQGSSVGPPMEIRETAGAGSGAVSPEAVNNTAVELTKLPEVVDAELNSQHGISSASVAALRRDLERALAEELKKKEVDLRVGPEGLIVSLREVGFFDSGSAQLRPDAEPAMARIAEILRTRPVTLRVEGHTDNVPIHTAQFKSNWELSTARATELVKVLISQYSFTPGRLSAGGYGQFHPIASNATAEGRRQNRRVDLVILAAPERKSSAPMGASSGRKKTSAATKPALPNIASTGIDHGASLD